MHDIINFSNVIIVFYAQETKLLALIQNVQKKKKKNHGNITLIESKLLTRQLHNNTES